MSLRTTRSRTRAEAHPRSMPQVEYLNMPDSNPISTFCIPDSMLSTSAKPVSSLSPTLTRKQTGLKQKAHVLLLQKQCALRTLDLPSTHTKQEYFVSQSASSRASNLSPHQLRPAAAELNVNISNAISSTLVFAGESGGTAVCIHESGLILTCAHCIAESRDEFERYHSDLDNCKPLWLVTATGDIVSAKCIAWDGRRDLALLRIVSSQDVGGVGTGNAEKDTTQREFRALRISLTGPALRTEMVCIGQPGSEDLEAAIEGIETGYPALAVSQGWFLGYAKGQDVEDNSEIGALKHNAWTYWGHSGAPIVDFDSKGGCLIGLHSSWDDQTGTRRGVGIEAIHGFLCEIDRVLQGANSSNIIVRT